MQEYIKGMDLSSVLEEERCGAQFYDKEKPSDLFSILVKNGVNSFRFRLWHTPYSEQGEAYGGGTNDMPALLELARRAQKAKTGYLLDIHYSDFWADPGKQFKPKAWTNYNNAELEIAIYQYTKQVMLTLKQKNLLPEMVQIGNELSNGMLWPNGKVPHYEAITQFINAGIRAVREIDDRIPIMLHLDNGGNNALYRTWFDHYLKKGEYFEVIGLSYYPFWHGSLADLSKNMDDLAVRYEKDLIVAETSTGFTLEDYAEWEGGAQFPRKGMAATPFLAKKVPYPMTPKGQQLFLQDLNECIRSVPGHKGRGFYYWEGSWIPVAGCGWATEAACNYLQDAGPGGNEWANQALFNYAGRALPALADFKSL